jgi:thymidylate synthase
MSFADDKFVEMCENILKNGTNTMGQKIRPKWSDGTPAYTIKQFGIVNKYDLRKEFPALTLRKTAIKSAMDEILWIFQKKSNNIKDLKPHIWDEWADSNGSIGSAYGYQIGKSFNYTNIPNEEGTVDKVKEQFKDYPSFSYFERYYIEGSKRKVSIYLDQMDAVLYQLRNTPYSRRIMTSIWNFDDLSNMNLQPCCWNCTFNVTNEGGDKLVLNMILNQRSNDVLAANNWNVVQYSLLLMMIAQSVNMIPGALLHVIADAHIYDRHVPLIEELIKRERFDAPTVTLNPDIKDFYKFTTDDIKIENYKYGEQIKNIPIAI